MSASLVMDLSEVVAVFAVDGSRAHIVFRTAGTFWFTGDVKALMDAWKAYYLGQSK